MADVLFDRSSRIYPGSEIPAVNALELEVGDGELLVLVGPSGSGKSTALRMLAGLEPVDEGRVLIGGNDVTSVAPQSRDIAMVFQNYALYPSMTVAANMGFALKQQKVPKEERTKRVREAARILDLEDYLDRKPKNLSGGQRQRVAMGRAIVRNPQVFLMDEPLSNLDAKLRVQTRTELAELQARLGVTTVYVTHDQVEAMTMGHRVAVLRDGKLQQVDSPSTLYSAPVNRFVAGFIGSPAMNLFECELSHGRPQLGGVSMPVDDAVAAKLEQSAAGEVTFGVRPEHLTLGPDRSDTIAGQVVVVEELGSEAFVHVQVDHRGETHTLVVRDEGETSTRRGDGVHVAVGNKVHIFNPSGDRISV